MICFNGTNGTIDSKEESISSPLSCSPLSSSPVKSQTIKDLLESPIINRSQNSNSYSDEEIIVAESPEHEYVDEFMRGDNCNEDTDSIKEVPMTQELDTSIDRSNGRSLRRQTSICVTSSPRALAILKNAIKISNNSNINCDKSFELNAETNGFSVKSNIFNNNNIIIGTNSPPNHKVLAKSPFSRGSALLRAAKERISKEYGTPPKTGIYSMKDISNDLYNDSMTRDIQLTSILRKRELQSSPTFSEPKAKKKKVLFAEPVVSSEREFDCLPLFNPSILSVKAIENQFENQFNESNDRKRNNLVHQNSTFQDNGCDSNDSDSPLLITQYFKETIDPVCYEDSNLNDNCLDDNQIKSVHNSNDAELVPDSYDLNDSGIPLITEDISEISSEDRYPCSQPKPINTDNDEVSKNSGENCGSVDFSPIDANEDEDHVINVPMRLSLIKELYNLFGTIIEQYSDT